MDLYGTIQKNSKKSDHPSKQAFAIFEHAGRLFGKGYVHTRVCAVEFSITSTVDLLDLSAPAVTIFWIYLMQNGF